MFRAKFFAVIIAAFGATLMAAGVAYGAAADGQYGDPAGGGGTSSLFGLVGTIDGNGDGVFGEGDTLTFQVEMAGEIVDAAAGKWEDAVGQDLDAFLDYLQNVGASALKVCDSDGTCAWFTAGGNGRLIKGSLILEPTAEGSFIEGGDGELAEEALTIEDSTGLTLAATPAEEGGALPNTGGEFMMLGGGLLVLFGAGYALRRATRGGNRGGAAA